MVDLLEIVRRTQGAAMVEGFARMSGLPPDQVRRALEALMPAFAMGLERNAAANPAGFAEFLRAGHPMLAFFDPARAFTPQARAEGASLVGPLFGSAQVSQEVVRQAAAMSGVAGPALRQMLPILAGIAVAGIVHAALNQDYAQQFASFAAAMQGQQRPEPQPAPFPDLFGMMLGRPAPPPPPPPPPPTPMDTMQHLFEAGREVQAQHVAAFQAIFDAFWGVPPKRP